MKKVGLFVTVTLGILTAFGPFVTDFYLPFLPEMSRSFHTSPSAVSTSLTAGMVGLAAGQILASFSYSAACACVRRCRSTSVVANH